MGKISFPVHIFATFTKTHSLGKDRLPSVALGLRKKTQHYVLCNFRRRIDLRHPQVLKMESSHRTHRKSHCVWVTGYSKIATKNFLINSATKKVHNLVDALSSTSASCKVGQDTHYYTHTQCDFRCAVRCEDSILRTCGCRKSILRRKIHRI